MTAQTYALRITVRLSSGVNDPQGNTVRDGLRSLGHADVRDVRVGKIIDLVVDAESADEAQERGQRMCQELLANPVIETFDIDVMEVSKA
jgi:phosphoribosylformylglycinamidine synthase PurS subunit